MQSNRRRQVRGALVPCVVGLSVLVSACGGSSSSSSSAAAPAAASSSTSAATTSTAASTASQKQFVVGFSNPTGAQPSLNTTQAAVTALGKRLGIKVISLDAQLNTQKQVSDINQFIAQKVNGIIVFPLAPNTLNPALQRARQAGIKILGWDAFTQKPASGANIAPYDANFDQGLSYGGAKQLATLVGTTLHGSGNVLGIGIGAPVPSIAFQVQQYQHDIAAGYPNLKWLGTVQNATDDIAGGQKVTAQAITRFGGKINAVMSYNDDSAIGAAIALKSNGTHNAVIVGEGGTSEGVNAVKSGQITASVDIVPWRQGLIAATMMHDLLTNQSVPTWIENPVVMYTKSNIGKRLDWNTAVSQIASGQLTCANGGCPAPLNK
jgi:ribose transport system substrate-binding protein